MQTIIVLLLVFFAGPVFGQEMYFLGGGLRAFDSGEMTYTWQLEYRQALGDRSAFSVSYINEGHPPGHRRDGAALQLWGRMHAPDRRFSLEAGVGPYLYCDTAGHPDDSYSDRHGWGAVFSLAGTVRLYRQWDMQARINLIGTDHSTGTLSGLIGIGYRFGPEPQDAPYRYADAGNEISLLLGQTTVNSFDSETALAQYVEYRRVIGRHVEWTFSLLHEGKDRLLCRYGIASQLWAAKSLMEERLKLGVGFGPYLVFDDCRDEQGDRGRKAFAGLVTFTGSYRIDSRWLIRASWSRIITDYDRDTDLFLIGPGFRF